MGSNLLTKFAKNCAIKSLLTEEQALELLGVTNDLDVVYEARNLINKGYSFKTIYDTITSGSELTEKNCIKTIEKHYNNDRR